MVAVVSSCFVSLNWFTSAIKKQFLFRIWSGRLLILILKLHYKYEVENISTIWHTPTALIRLVQSSGFWLAWAKTPHPAALWSPQAHAHLRVWSERRACIGLDTAKKGMVKMINICINITFMHCPFVAHVFYLWKLYFMLKLCTIAPWNR